ncbi:hypothetical protein Patl1_20481 [Pistacia atlantica]|uniref:Uncharacterized protein n=1 Tax=Pistacia atlantica TaxID=434234 RepID=A0ACC1BM09_9ROSI|nr:hypothetical protein Patl1_20481 [Pistacia atlantica]
MNRCQLKRLHVKSICNDDHHRAQLPFNQALPSTEEDKPMNWCAPGWMGPTHSISADWLDVPEVFRCPISGEIMADPVVLARPELLY